MQGETGLHKQPVMEQEAQEDSKPEPQECRRCGDWMYWGVIVRWMDKGKSYELHGHECPTCGNVD